MYRLAQIYYVRVNVIAGMLTTNSRGEVTTMFEVEEERKVERPLIVL